MFVASRDDKAGEGEEKEEKGTPAGNEGGVLADTSHLLERDDWSSSVKMEEGDWSPSIKSIPHWLDWRFSIHQTSKMWNWS